MRIYSASNEENLRTRRLLKEWETDGLLTHEQYQQLEKDTPVELRTTNVFLRLVLFFFTAIIVGASVGLFYVVFLSRPSEQTFGVFLLIFSAACYAAAEFAASRARLYHYGIEEALVVCSVGFLCVGSWSAFFSGSSSATSAAGFVVPTIGAVASLWIWHRFGLWYAFLGAMIFALFPPGYWTSSHSAQRVIIVALYAIGLMCVVVFRSGHRYDYLEDTYSLAEAFLWLGIYLVLNLKLSSSLPSEWWFRDFRSTSEFPKPFYWTTWVLIWCVPPVVLARGIRLKDRFVIGIGAVVAVLTLVSNKPYLGWPRHTWDPMLLGILLTGVALFIRRWIARGPAGVRQGFTAERLSAKDKHWMSTGSAVLGVIAPQAMPKPQASSPDVRFGGGASGGGGASSEF